MSYCLNPACPNPENLDHEEICQACGSQLMLQNKYRVVKPLGQGGFGATFLAKDQLLPGEPCCVIKQLRPTATAPHVFKMAQELFVREAETLGKIGNHPQIPLLLAYFEDHQQFYLVQEYVSGDTLQREVKQNGPFSEEGVKQFLSEILPVLQYIHGQKVIHRDIKPANIIRRNQDRKLVLIDFGAVKNQVNQAATNSSDQTALTAYAIGTPGFAPPEQMAMRPVYASDIYALGVTCIYLLSGKSPKDLDYNPSTGEMLWEKHVRMVNNLSDHFANVLRKMLEVSVRDRFQCANDVLRALDLEPYLDSLAQGMIAGPPSGPSPSSASKFGPNSLNSGAGAFKGSVSSNSVSRAAMAIRARRTRLEGTDVHSGISGYRGNTNRNGSNVPSSDNFTGSKGKNIKRKLDAQEVQTSYSKGRRDFAQQNLSLLNLQKVDLSEAIFHQARLNRTNLQGANLFRANFGRASLNQAILRDANLSKAYLSYADLEGADLRGADLRDAHLMNANLRGANLCGANLTGARITEEQLAMAKTNWMTVRPTGKRGGIW
ncbi:protein kinase domain-containing protein [Floridanema evergladense]|uniref:Serine/threonine-protein kinase B n=1 Tax=Floridaenema evergladense BLCC-F167 TaxID=3153639 RepID=A0ABV4WQA9_9CYAN